MCLSVTSALGEGFRSKDVEPLQLDVVRPLPFEGVIGKSTVVTICKDEAVTVKLTREDSKLCLLLRPCTDGSDGIVVRRGGCTVEFTFPISSKVLTSLEVLMPADSTMLPLIRIFKE